MKRFILMCLGIATFVVLGMARAEENNTQTTETKPKEKRKVLILQIIEENWDNLEFTPPLYDIIGSEYKPPTKRQVMEWRKEFHIIRAKEDVIKSIKLNYNDNVRKKYLPKDLKVHIFHTIKYFGKTDELKDNDVLEESIYRFDIKCFTYYYEGIPEKISLLTEPRSFRTYDKRFISNGKDGWYPSSWTQFKHVRLVGDIHILSVDKLGNLKIKYDEKTYNLKVSRTIELPFKETNMDKEQLENYENKFQKEIEKRWGMKTRIDDGLRSILTEGNLWFKTKLTIINYGYVEVEL